MAEFLHSLPWYQYRGIPFRRGYLLYGPSGPGKTSLIHALASHFGMSVSLLDFGQNLVTTDRIINLFNNLPEKTILLLEDVDRIFEREARLTPSRLLNALDGIGAGEGRITFMTTNHLNMLDDALIRPGIIDLKVFIGDANGEQARLRECLDDSFQLLHNCLEKNLRWRLKGVNFLFLPLPFRHC